MPKSIYLLLATLAVLVGGCSSTKNPAAPNKVAERTSFWSPHLLYLSNDRYSRLHVEVDAVKGAEPNQVHLDRLKGFLQAQCQKPGGVRIVRSDVIPEHQARNRTPETVALQNINGPPDSSTAFLYILYWDSDIMTGDKTTPETTLLPYPCSIFVDRRYDPYGQFSKYGDLILAHEAAHALGLCRNKAHGDGVHCTNRDCLMNEVIKFDLWGILNNRDPKHQREFCRDCYADLETGRARSPAPNLSFVGPYLARAERNYAVLSLPGFVYVHFGGLASLDRTELRRDTSNTSFALTKPDEVHASSSRITDLPFAQSLVPQLKRDPYAAVREIGEELERQLPGAPLAASVSARSPAGAGSASLGGRITLRLRAHHCPACRR